MHCQPLGLNCCSFAGEGSNDDSSDIGVLSHACMYMFIDRSRCSKDQISCLHFYFGNLIHGLISAQLKVQQQQLTAQPSSSKLSAKVSLVMTHAWLRKRLPSCPASFRHFCAVTRLSFTGQCHMACSYSRRHCSTADSDQHLIAA